MEAGTLGYLLRNESRNVRLNVLIHIAFILSLFYFLTVILFIIGLYLPAKSRNQQRLRVSVVIAARNEERHIGYILKDLVRQSYPKNLYEIIIANDGSDDRTSKIVLEYASKHPQVKLLTIGECPHQFSPKKFAIETAVRHASGEIIMATDADCRVGPKWIEAMVRYFTPRVGFVIGFSQFGRRGQRQNLIERLQAFDFLTLMGVASASCNLGLPLAASGQNLAYRRDAFLSVNGYRRIAHRTSGDDVLLLQLIRRGTPCDIVFANNPLTFASSEAQPTLRQFINQRKRWASNGSFQLFLNIPFFLYLLLVYLYNVVLLFAIVLSLLFSFSIILFLCIILKALSEGLIAGISSIRFNRTDLMKYFPLWFIIQIPYVSLIGIMGTFGNFSWKGRKHSATV
ncbi:glycosyltransferase [candidate division KSB1 bacterium]|nr:glycosyltransferase [candidate division KSB1 bacterium]